MTKDDEIRELKTRVKKLEKQLNQPRQALYGKVILDEYKNRTLIEDILLRLTNLEGASPP